MNNLTLGETKHPFYGQVMNMVQNVTITGVSNATVPAKPSTGSAANSVAPPNVVAPAEAPTGTFANAVPSEAGPDLTKGHPETKSGGGVPTSPVPNMLTIAHDLEANVYVYRGIDNETNEVQGQWPTEQALKRMAMMRQMSGKLFDEES